MGMSASQARLLSLAARQNDVEFEAQQINQQRLILSNKMNEIQNQVYDMDVPVPPSKQDFMYNVYEGKTNNGKKVTAVVNQDGSFTVTKTKTGDIVVDAGFANITNGVYIKGKKVNIDDLESDAIIAKAKECGYIVNPEDKMAYPVSDMTNEQIIACITNGYFIIQQSSEGESYLDSTRQDSVTINGCETMNMQEAKENFSDDETFNRALIGLNQSFPNDEDKFTVIISSDGKAFSFCRTSEISDGEGKVNVFAHSTGEYDEVIEGITDENVLFDEKGYPSSIILPNGETIRMNIKQEVNEDEYDIALNKYNIDKIEYDKEQNELNKKTSIYQREDKTLELKLTRLDTERNALNTEIEAVKKIIQDATESGFKTFSG